MGLPLNGGHQFCVETTDTGRYDSAVELDLSEPELGRRKDAVNGAMGEVAVISVEAEMREEAIIKSNQKRLSRWYGEQFVKGLSIGDDELAVGARQLLARFMGEEGFAYKVKELIPNKHRAYKTLIDNLDYFIGELEKCYPDDCEDIKDSDLQDPYQLAEQAGYELTGPFESVEELDAYKQDTRASESLCVFLDPQSRLDDYHIVWLRRPDVDKILPADELTQHNLTSDWRVYLRQIGRYDKTTDAYNLDGLQPSRHDPYAVSSMSFQASRQGRRVFMTNRYNHSVTNPDNTYNSNLDRIKPGLRRAVYSLIGRSDLMDQAPNILDGPYVRDESGGVHAYYFKEGNTYFGNFEYVENQVVRTIDRSQYDMISPDLYVDKCTGEAIGLSYIYQAKDIRHSKRQDGVNELYISDKPSGELLRVYRYSHDSKGRTSSLSLELFKKGRYPDDMRRNPIITELKVSGNFQSSSISNYDSLSRIVLGRDSVIAGISGNNLLNNIVLEEGSKVGSISYNRILRNIKMAKDSRVARITSNPALKTLEIAESSRFDGVYDNESLIINNLPDLA